MDNFIKKLQERDQNARFSSVYTGHQPRTPTQNNSRIENPEGNIVGGGVSTGGNNRDSEVLER